MQPTPNDNTLSRREFFRTCARNTILAAGGAGLAALGLRGRITKTRDQTCINNSVCRSCSAYSNCSLPAALSRQQHHRKHTNT